MGSADSATNRTDDGSLATLECSPASRSDSARDLGPVWVFPGLGCRFVGMGADLFGKSPVADAIFSQAQEILGYDLREVCLEGSGRKIVPAKQEAQVIYTVSCGYAAALRSMNRRLGATAGHSLGNWAAAWAAGAYDFPTGLRFVTQVEDLLEELVAPESQTMGVVIGLEESTVKSLIAEHTDLWLANWNSPGQYIVGGDAKSVDALLSAATGLQAKRSKRLPTDRALHTPLMQAVSERLREVLDSEEWSEPSIPLISSADSRVLRSSAEVREFFGSFLDQPVRWDATIRSLCENSVADYVEVGPGNVLGSMFPFIDNTADVRSASELLEQDVAP